MSCLYNSLSFFLKDVSPNHLRHQLCNYLGSNPKINDSNANEVIRWENGMHLPHYINKMRHNNQWGGAIEIKCFCDLHRVNVIVYSIPNRRKIEFLSNSKSNKTFKIYWTGNHYEPITHNRFNFN